MQIIESFTAIVPILNRSRRVRYSGLDGLTIEGLTISEARAITGAIEQLDAAAIAALLGRAPADPTPPRAPDPVAPAVLDAQRAPETAQAPEGDAAPPSAVDTAPAPAGALQERRVPRRDTRPAPAVGDGGAPTAGRPAGKGAAGRLAPPKPQELAALPVTGDAWEGVKITSHVDHGDGGRLLVCEDGTRVKLNAKGAEVGRFTMVDEAPAVTAAPAPEPEPSPAAVAEEAVQEIAEAPPQADTESVPDEVMKSETVRDVIRYLHDHGVAGEEPLVAKCLTLRSQGALAFKVCRDEEAVRRRVRSTMAVLGLM